MKSLHEIIAPVGAALVEELGDKVFHYWRPRLSAPFCVWAEDGEGVSLETGNHKAEQAVSGYVDYYTGTEADTNVDAIQTALNGVDGLVWRLDSVQFEDGTKLIHFQWTWEAS